MSKFEEYFKIENAIRIYGSFNAVMGGFPYDEESVIGRNGLKENGKNKFNLFLNKHFKIRNNNKKNNPFLKDLIDGCPNVRLMYAEGMYCPCFDYFTFLTNVLNLLVFTNVDEKQKYVKGIRSYDVDGLCALLKSSVKKEIIQVNRFIDNKASSYNMMNPFILSHLSRLGNKLDKKKNKDVNSLLIDYRKKLDLLYEYINESFETYHTLLDYDELVKCFDYDKYNLLVIRGIFDNCFRVMKSNHYYDKYIHIVKCYIDSVERYRLENPKYNPKVIIGIKNGREIFYSYEDLVKDFGKYLELYPEFEPSFIEEIFADNEFPWEIIPVGNNLGNNSEPAEPTIPREKSTIDKDSKKLRVVEGYEYLVSKQLVSKFRGKNIFDGYIGFQFDNGIVIFEKVYDKNGDIAIMNATYAMTIENFTYFSKRTKPEIIHILKKAKTNIWRFYHTENMSSWRSKVDMLTTGIDYTSEDIEAINTLLELDEKKKSKN
jgi:hypothetical protein